MNPGRELDALVAEKVMGLVPERVCYLRDRTEDFYRVEYHRGEDGPKDMWGKPVTHQLKPYSTEIAAAWEVVEKMASNGHFLRLYNGSAVVSADFFYPLEGYVAEAGSAPHAICLAALKAVGCELGK